MSALVETMAYAGELPWHGLGTKVPSDLTPLRQFGQGWKLNVVSGDPWGGQHEGEGHAGVPHAC